LGRSRTKGNAEARADAGRGDRMPPNTQVWLELCETFADPILNRS
jgi:hypothetical protein